MALSYPEKTQASRTVPETSTVSAPAESVLDPPASVNVSAAAPGFRVSAKTAPKPSVRAAGDDDPP